MSSLVPLLEACNLRAGYGATKVLHGLDLSLAEGSITAMLGANGAGKTTTLRALCAMVPSEGEIRFAGIRIDRRSTEDIARIGVAHVPEGRGTFLRLSTEENLRVGAYVRRDRAGLARDFERIYAYFPRLAERRRQQAGTLSGGEQQMLAVSRALMMRPRLLLLDEPSFGLAPRVVEDLFRILRQVNAAEGVGVLLVEQNAAMALAIADRAIVLEAGHAVLSGAADDIRRNDAVRTAYLGS